MDKIDWDSITSFLPFGKKKVAGTENKVEHYRLDNEDVMMVSTISRWERESWNARESIVSNFFGSRFQGEDGGMQGLVRVAHRNYTPQTWANAPYSYELSAGDIDHLCYPWFFGNVQNILSTVNPQNLQMKVYPLDTQDKTFSTQLNAIYREELEYLKFNRVAPMMTLGAKLYGYQVAYFGYSMRRGVLNTERCMDLCDPLAVLVDPSATSLDNAKYIIYKRHRLISDIEREYNLKPNSIQQEQLDQIYSTDYTIGRGRIEGSPYRAVETIVWINDSEQEEELHPNQKFPDNPELAEKVLVDKYPNGRLVVMVNKEIVWDTPNPYNHKKCPFIKLDNYPVPFSFYSLPEWYVVGDVPHVIDESISSMARRMRLTSKLLVDTSAIKGGAKDISNDSSEIIFVESGMLNAAIHTVEIGSSNRQDSDNLSAAMAIGDKIMAVNDALRGQPDPSITSGKQAQILTAQASNRHQNFVQDFNNTLEEAGYIILHNAVQFMPLDELEQILSTVEIHDASGQPISFDIRQFDLQGFYNKVKFKAKMIPQSALPTDRQERLKYALEIIPQILQIYQVSPEMAKVIVKLTDNIDIQEAWDEAQYNLEIQKQLQAEAAMQQHQAEVLQAVASSDKSQDTKKQDKK